MMKFLFSVFTILLTIQSVKSQCVEFVKHMDRSDLTFPIKAGTGTEVDMDGDYAVVGIPGGGISTSNFAGLAIIYKYDAATDTWSELKTLFPSQAVNQNFYGWDVEIQGDLIAVSEQTNNAATANAEPGGIYIYQKDLGGLDNWGELKYIEAPSEISVNQFFGYGLSLTDSILAVTSPNMHLTIFERDLGGQDNWGFSTSFDSEMGTRTLPNIIMKGDMLFYTNLIQGTYIRERNEGGPDNWGQVKFIPHATSQLGGGLAVEDNLLLIGSGNAIQVHKRNQGGTDNWGQVQSIAGGLGFGRDIHISDNLVVASDYASTIAGFSRAGRAILFDFDPSLNQPLLSIDTLTASSPQGEDYFASAIGFAGDKMVIGATFYNLFALPEDMIGRVLFLSRNSGGTDNWGEVLEINDTDSGGDGPLGFGDRFGNKMRSYDDMLLVSAPLAVDNGIEGGSAYLYRENEGGANNWGEVKKLTSPNPQNNKRFGKTMSIFSDKAAIGENGDIHIYYKDAGGADNWGLIKTINQDSRSVAVFDTLLAVADGAGKKIFIYHKDEGGVDNWGFVKELEQPNVVFEEINVIKTDGEKLFVGDPGPFDKSFGFGRSFLYAKDEGGIDNWGLVQSLDPLVFDNRDDYGNDLDYLDDLLVVTSQHSDSGGAEKLIVFKEGQNGYEEELVISPPKSGTEKFGRSIGLTDEYMVTGDSEAETGQIDGIGFLYGRDKGGLDNWGFVTEILPLNNTTEVGYGLEVDVIGTSVFIHASLGNSHGLRSGSVSHYEISRKPFITEWALSANEVITIPMSSQPYRFEYKWILNSDPTVVIEGNHFSLEDGDFTTTFTQGGIYTLEITGLFPHLTGYPVDKLLDVKQWGDNDFFSMEASFKGWSGATFSAEDTPSLVFASDFSSAFADTPNFNHDISDWDMSSATDLDSMFAGAVVFNQPIGAWNVQNVSSFDYMFRDNGAINQDLGNWKFDETDSVVDVFLNATAFDCENWSKTIVGWETNNPGVDNVMIGGPNTAYDVAAGFARQELVSRGWTINGSEVTGPCVPFITLWAVADGDVISIGTSDGAFEFQYTWIDEATGEVVFSGSHTAVDGAFETTFSQGGQYILEILGTVDRMADYPKNKLLDVLQWGTNLWQNMDHMFENWLGTSFSAGDAPILSQVSSMNSMFFGASNFNDGLNHWDVSNVDSMQGMFHLATSFNKALGKWNLSNVIDLSDMFREALNFNQNLSSWRFHPSVNLNAIFKDATGMSCNNWSPTIIAWNFAHPELTNQSLDVEQLSHGIHAASSVDELNARGWNVASTEIDGFCTEIALKYWTGNVDTRWDVEGNWHNLRVPRFRDKVVIPKRPNQPILEIETQFMEQFDLLRGATFIITPASELKLVE